MKNRLLRVMFAAGGLCLLGPRASALALPPPGGDACAEVTIPAVDNVIALVSAARDQAERACGRPGACGGLRPQAAQANLDHITGALTELRDLRAWLLVGGDNNPAVTTYAEAPNVELYVDRAIDRLRQARWQAMVVAVYTGSADYARADSARRSFEYGAQAIEAGNVLATRAGRCFIGAYLR